MTQIPGQIAALVNDQGLCDPIWYEWLKSRGTGLGSSGPAFAASAGATQTISSGTFTKVALDTEAFDTANCFDSSTNYRFTPNVAGYYLISGVVRYGGTITSTALACIFKNGSEYARGLETTVLYQCNVAEVLYLNGSTDYVELYGFMTGSGTLTFTKSTSVVTSHASGCFLRAT